VLLSREGWLYREIFRLFIFMLSLKTGMSSNPINPSTLFRGAQIGRNVKFLLTLVNKKWPPGIYPGGHHFVVLNVSPF
jgi:hypothetical protein